MNLFNKNFTLHFSAYLMLSVAFYLLIPTLPIFATDLLCAENSQVGYIIGIYALAALVFRPLTGYCYDRMDKKKVYLISLLASVLVIYAYNHINSVTDLLLIRVLHGIVWSFITTGASAIAVELIPSNQRGQGVSYFGLSFVIGMAIGPMIGQHVLMNYNFSMLFSMTAFISALALIISCLLHLTIDSSANLKVRKFQLYEPRALRISMVILLMGFPYALVLTFITLYAQELKLDENGLFFTFFAGGIILSRITTGKIMDAKGPLHIMMTCYLIGLTGLILIIIGHSDLLFLAAGLLLGFGNGSILPLLMTMINNLVNQESRGIANATFYTAADLGIGIGSIFLGYIAKLTSLKTMLIFTAFVEFTSLVLFLTIVYNHYNKHKLIKYGKLST